MVSQIFPIRQPQLNSEIENTKIRSLEELKPYLGKVVKFTSDWGQTWNYFLLDQFVYSEQSQDISGLKCFSEKRSWNRHLIGASALFTKEAFMEGPFSKPQSYFELASYKEFSDRPFMGISGSGKLPEEAASKPCSNFPQLIDFPPMICKAPLTIIRSEKPTKLAVSILFDPAKHDPCDPIFPSPSEIETSSRTFIWNIQSQEDGTLSVGGTDDKVKMIWWEAVRKTAPIPFTPELSGVTVDRNDLPQMLQDILAKKGVKESEARAFVQYWDQTAQRQFNSDAPYVTIELVEESDLDKFLPPMKADSSEAEFSLKRFYFRFQPSDEKKGMEPSAYLDAMKPASIGPNAVIDLGGEVVPSKYQREKTDEKEFIEQFINTHVKVPSKT